MRGPTERQRQAESHRRKIVEDLCVFLEEIVGWIVGHERIGEDECEYNRDEATVDVGRVVIDPEEEG